jgi:cell division transport system ATP-binding protein
MNNPIVALRNISVVQDEKVIIRNVSFYLYPQEMVYLIGKVGSGKTSLLKTLYAELPLENGNVEINGFNLKNLSIKKIPYLRRGLGIVFQDFKLLTDRNVHENLKFVLDATGWKDKNLVKQRIKEVLTDVMLTNKELAMPNELSGGEQQRVVIARALLNSPTLILADEPTGNLDPVSAAQIMTILQGLTLKGSCVLFATHQYNLIKQYPGRILKIEDEELEEIRQIEI